MTSKSAWGLTKQTFSEWSEDHAPRLAAALAYYTIFSIAPLLVIVIAIAGFVFGHSAAQGQVIQQMRSMMGEQGAQVVQTLLSSAGQRGTGIVASILGIIALLLGATGVFNELQQSLNTIWEVQPRPGLGIWGTIRQRFLSFTLILGIGFLLLVSLVLSAVVGVMARWVGGMIPGLGFLPQVLDIVVSLAVITLLFAMIFKILPDVKIAWRDVWLGAAITAVLFTIGKYLLGLYLGRSSTTSVYGAAGSLVLLILWVYYSAQILFLGAEFTQVYTRRVGRGLRPAEHAMPLTEEARAEQGIPSQGQRQKMEAADASKRPEPAFARSHAQPHHAVGAGGAGRAGGSGKRLLPLVAGVLIGRLLPPYRRTALRH